jgi:hypothetical protein
MRHTALTRRRFRPRHAVAVLLFVSQFICAFGVPIFAATATTATPYPCRGHACGCASADECWQGDCCCFTLEEKLAWADANGIEPPSHVRPTVAARKSRSRPACCRAAGACDAKPHGTCPSCAAEKKIEPGVQWAVAFRAQKCRGEGPLGLFTLPPTIVPKPPSGCLAAETTGLAPGYVATRIITSSRPPTPPPRVS